MSLSRFRVTAYTDTHTLFPPTSSTSPSLTLLHTCCLFVLVCFPILTLALYHSHSHTHSLSSVSLAGKRRSTTCRFPIARPIARRQSSSLSSAHRRSASPPSSGACHHGGPVRVPEYAPVHRLTFNLAAAHVSRAALTPHTGPLSSGTQSARSSTSRAPSPSSLVRVRAPRPAGRRDCCQHHAIDSAPRTVSPTAGKNRRLTFIECNNDMNSMIDVGKIADLVRCGANAWQIAAVVAQPRAC